MGWITFWVFEGWLVYAARDALSKGPDENYLVYGKFGWGSVPATKVGWLTLFIAAIIGVIGGFCWWLHWDVVFTIYPTGIPPSENRPPDEYQRRTRRRRKKARGKP